MKPVTHQDVSSPRALRKILDTLGSKIESLHERVAQIEMKMDAKPTQIKAKPKGVSKKVIASILVIFMLGIFTVPADAELPHRQKERFYNDIATEKGFEAKGTNTLSGTTTVSGPTTLSGSTITVSTALTGTDVVTSTNIVDNTGTINFPLGAAMVDGTGPILSSTAPNLTTKDNVAAILYDDSGETTPVQWTFRLPDDYVSGLTFYVMVSSDDASGAATKLDWALTKNSDGVGFGSVTAQDLVTCTSSTLDASNEVLTLTPDATGIALFTSGSILSLEIFNASTNDDDLEIKAVWGEYTKSQ